MQLISNKKLQLSIAMLSALCLAYIYFIILYQKHGILYPIVNFFAEIFTIPIIILIGLCFFASLFGIIKNQINYRIIITLLLSVLSIILMIISK